MPDKDCSKKYILLAGENYYPQGWDDFRGTFDSIDEAKAWFGENATEISSGYISNWCQIIDRESLEVVAAFDQGHDGDYRNPGPMRDAIGW